MTTTMSPSVKQVRDNIRETITDEIFLAFGLKRDGFLRRTFGRLFFRPANRFSEIFARADEATGQAGLPGGSRVVASNMDIQVELRGGELMPAEGPLLVVSNHPGAYDSVALAYCIPRIDLKVIAFETQFYHTLPNISQRMIMAPADPSGRMIALRSAIQNLQTGGSIMQFGSGKIEPDPAIADGTDEWFENWSPSLEAMLRKVPDTRLVLAIVSGVLLRRFAKHPITHLRHGGVNQRRIAEFMQVINHLTSTKPLNIQVRVNFSAPISLADLQRDASDKRLMSSILAHASRLLEEHRQQYYPA